MERKYISVNALNQYLKARFQQDIQLQNIYIKGEISNYRPHPSGHLYFTLKDEASKVSAVMFSSDARKMNFKIENGMQVLIQARVGVYEANGVYQLFVKKIDQDGIGNLYVAYLQLKEKLEKEGLFDQSHKKEIPKIPHSIAVLSAKQGAAVQDVVSTIHTRAPFVKVVVFPIPVQGENAFIVISKVLKQVDVLGFDTIILARGGGSIEDLNNFNSELLARVIFACKTPIISGIGHETDFTICDFVSDLRAVTPTGAAIAATCNIIELKHNLLILNKRLRLNISNRLNSEKKLLEGFINSYMFKNPDQLYANEIIKVNLLENRLKSQIQLFEQKNKQKNERLLNRIYDLLKTKLNKAQFELNMDIGKLDAYSPLKILSRGYSIVYKDNHMIKTIEQLNDNDDIDIKFSDGKVKAKVMQVKS